MNQVQRPKRWQADDRLENQRRDELIRQSVAQPSRCGATKIVDGHENGRASLNFTVWRVVRCASVLGVVLSGIQVVDAQMTLPGKFTVSSTGAATYSIPLALPSGTAGMTPTLSLDYNSGAGNGIVGIGWSLAGLPTLGRCPRTVAQDGVLGGINYDANDRFCLDGQRLAAVSGTYGADGTEYRTEVESFSRVISHGVVGAGPAWFEIRTKTGQRMEFGNTTDSRVLAQGKATVGSWALNKVSDTKGNYFTVNYANDSANGQAYPIEVDYTGNAAAGLTPFNKVQFVYETRPDISVTYQAGSMSKVAVRLTNVKTYGGASLVGDYRLSYQQSAGTGRSLVSSVAICDAAGACLPSTNFSWVAGDDASLTVKPYVEFFPPGAGYGSSTGWTPLWFDVDGDGKTDLVLTYQDSALGVRVALSNGDGTFAMKPYVELFPAGAGYGLSTGWTPSWFDINGDGKVDLVLTYQGSTVGARVALSNGDGTFEMKPYVEFFPPGSGYGLSSGWKPSWFDVDGDGKADLVLTYQDSALGVRVALSNGDGTFAMKPYVELFPAGAGYGLSTGWTPSWFDVNGDGKTDLVLTYQSSAVGARVALSNGDGTFAMKPYVEFFPAGAGYGLSTGWHPSWTDVNGDGKFDLVLTYQSSALGALPILSNGDGTFTTKPYTEFFPAGAGYGVSTGWTPSWFDANGDGKSDLVLTYQDSALGVRPILSNGDGTFIVKPYVELFPAGAGYGLATGWNPPWIDVNGDGQADLILTYQGSALGAQAVINSSGPLAIQSITTGLGALSTLTYQPLSAGGALYARDTGSAYPLTDVQGSLYVVSRVDQANGVGGNFSSTYAYAGAKADMSAREFLGFRQMSATDLQTGIVETTNYLQSFPFVGLAESTAKTLASVTLHQATSTYRLSNAGNGTTVSAPRSASAPYRVSLTQKIDTASDLDGSAMPSTTSIFQYDSYGNATQVAVSKSDGYSKTTTNTYTNDTTNWLLGRLTTSNVVAQAP